MNPMICWLGIMITLSSVSDVCVSESLTTGIKSNHTRPRPKIPHPTTQTVLSLPSNASTIRENITHTFSCVNRTYGYYADVANDCQIFHVCLPMRYGDGRERMFQWSFICPERTQFNQENYTCSRKTNTIDCLNTEQYYRLNENFGKEDKNKRRRIKANENISSKRPWIMTRRKMEIIPGPHT